MTNAIIIGAGASRRRSPRGERRLPAREAREHARTAIPPRLFPAGHIVQGDCIEHMRAMQRQSADFILTDPPYFARYRSRDGRTIANDDHLAAGEARIGSKIYQDRLPARQGLLQIVLRIHFRWLGCNLL